MKYFENNQIKKHIYRNTEIEDTSGLLFGNLLNKYIDFLHKNLDFISSELKNNLNSNNSKTYR
jgi:hypothetical protein